MTKNKDINTQYEVIIPTACKDYNKLLYVVDSLKYLNPQPEKITVVYSDNIHPIEMGKLHNFKCPEVSYVDESKVLPLNKWLATGFRRPPWIYQQFIKLFNRHSLTDYYMIVDSDIILNRKLDVFSNNKPNFFMANDQDHGPYFRYSHHMFGFGREYPHSFISEIMLFSQVLTDHLLDLYLLKHYSSGSDQLVYSREEVVKDLYEQTCKVVCDDEIPADYELYGNMVEKHFGYVYNKVHIKSMLRGFYDEWNTKAIEDYIEEMKEKDIDTFTLHTWI